jgi:hypothetical protein
VDEKLERRALLAPVLPPSGTFDGFYRGTVDVSNGFKDNVQPASGEIIVSDGVANLGPEVGFLAGTVTITGYPGGTLSAPITDGTEDLYRMDQGREPFSIIAYSDSGGPDPTIVSIHLSGHFEGRRMDVQSGDATVITDAGKISGGATKPILLAQATDQAKPPRFKLGATINEFVPGSVHPLAGNTQYEVEERGGPPEEDGVDWETWFREWIQMINTRVFLPMLGAANANGHAVEHLNVRIDYEVAKDGTVTILSGESYGTGVAGETKRQFDANLARWAANAQNSFPSLHDPLPNDDRLGYTKKEFIRRSVTFSINLRGLKKPTIRLGAPPSETGEN